MTHDEAQFLARRIVNTFRSTPPVPEWVDALGPLDVAVASASVTRLRDEIEQGGLLIGRFMSRYREIHGQSRRPRPDLKCGSCQGAGWIECLDDRRHGIGCTKPRTGGCACHALVRCPDCASGHPTPARDPRPMSHEDYRRRLADRVRTHEAHAIAEARGWALAEAGGLLESAPDRSSL